jgi:hypothetical protein
MMRFNIKIRWGTSRGRDTWGYTTCSLFENGTRMAACNGGGYDMQGTVLGSWIARRFAAQLRKLTKEFYGLTFHDPNYNPGKAVVEGETVEQREKDGKSVGLERYQAFYSASSKLPTEKHTIPCLDGACGWSCMEKVLEAIGGKIQRTGGDSRVSYFTVEFPDEERAVA